MKPVQLTFPAALESESAVAPRATGGFTARADRLGDIAARAAVIVLFSFMAMRFGADFAETGRVTGLLLLMSELLVVVMTVRRRTAAVVDRSARARILTGLSMISPLLLVPAHVAAMVPGPVTVAISIAGIAIVITGKLSLGRSFGLIPANRGVVSSGLYRLVRHPIYMGYLVTHVAFVLSNPSGWNAMVLLVGDIALLARALCEERTLGADPLYRAYQQSVRWRVCPGLF
jgi:protein-S-isoprenylcysteine O-methyltransferase Ste14